MAPQGLVAHVRMIVVWCKHLLRGRASQTMSPWKRGSVKSASISGGIVACFGYWSGFKVIELQILLASSG